VVGRKKFSRGKDTQTTEDMTKVAWKEGGSTLLFKKKFMGEGKGRCVDVVG